MRKRRRPFTSLATEHDEAKSFVQWLETAKPKGWDLCFHVPNGSNKSRAAAGKFKAEGLRSGVPDYCYPLPSGGYHGLFIELKREKGGTLQESQKEWLVKLRSAGYCAVVAKGWLQAKEAVERYLSLGEKVDGKEKEVPAN